MSTVFSDAVKREGFDGLMQVSLDGIAGVLDNAGLDSTVIKRAFNHLLDASVAFDIDSTPANGERIAKLAEAFMAYTAPEVADATNRRTRAQYEAHFVYFAGFKSIKSTTVVLTDEQKAARKRFNASATRSKTTKEFIPYTG